ISIYDAKGSRVYTKSYAIASRYQLMEIDLRTAANGVYLIRLTDKSNRLLATGKVVIAH
ncbi:MAG: hypothetical protein RL316_987, partial [Bacteroidota bacterium]